MHYCNEYHGILNILFRFIFFYVCVSEGMGVYHVLTGAHTG